MQISFQHRVVGLYRTLALKIILLAVVFLVVPVILYRLNEIGDAQQSELLKHSVELQGSLITSVLQPYLERFDQESPDVLQKALDGVITEGASVKVLVRPGVRQESGGFLYVAAAPVVSPDYLKQERESLVKLGVFDRLAPSCEGEDGRTLQFTNPAGKAEIMTSLRSVHFGDNCWVIIATQGASRGAGLSPERGDRGLAVPRYLAQSQPVSRRRPIDPHGQSGRHVVPGDEHHSGADRGRR